MHRGHTSSIPNARSGCARLVKLVSSTSTSIATSTSTSALCLGGLRLAVCSIKRGETRRDERWNHVTHSEETRRCHISGRSPSTRV